ncbi:MAG: UTP--glucose-1-phosphate uridylyltransferase [Ilumatobacteraceae bacterium]
MRIRTAVIPAAGMGTRFLPATKAVPKELLPIIDTPAIQLVLDECTGAGIEHVVIITSPSKPSIEAYFAPAPEVVERLRSTGRDSMADALDRIGSSMRVSFVMQDFPHGLGHAVSCAREAVGDEPFAVLLPDELMADSGLLSQLIDVCEQTAASAVGLMQVPRADVSRYGVVDPTGPIGADGVVGVRTMVEKPPVADAPSELIIIGRYALTNDVFDHLDRVAPGAGGEIQLTDALRMQAEAGAFHGVLGTTRRFDTGTPLGWLTAVVDRALDDPVIGASFRAWLDSCR